MQVRVAEQRLAMVEPAGKCREQQPQQERGGHGKRGVRQRQTLITKQTRDQKIQVGRGNKAGDALCRGIPDALDGTRRIHRIERQAQQAINIPVKIDRHLMSVTEQINLSWS